MYTCSFECLKWVKGQIFLISIDCSTDCKAISTMACNGGLDDIPHTSKSC